MHKLYYIGGVFFAEFEYGKGYEISEILKISIKYAILYRIQIDIKNMFITELEIRKQKLLKFIK